MVKRSRCPLSVEDYLDLQGKIISRSLGNRRKFVKEHFVLHDNKFVEKNRLDDMMESNKAPLGIVSKEPSEDTEAYKNFLATNLGFIQETTKTLDLEGNISPTRFSDIASYLIDSEDPFIWANKSRQFGFSFNIAAQSLAKAMLKKKHTSIFVSYNEEESKEKIVFARELYESMPRKWKLQRKLKYDNKTSLVFEKSGMDSFETRILSYPQRIIRGKGGELDIRLDEAAHCIHIRKIYTSALPALIRSKSSTIWVGSTPAGKGGLFYEIGVNQDNDYAPFLRMKIPWWVIPEFCRNVIQARKQAWGMHTDERIHLFANDRLKLIRKSMTLDDFRQEYEIEFLDEAYSYFPWDLINSCTPIFDVDAKEVPEYDSPSEELTQNDSSKSGVGVDHYTDFDEFMFAIDSGIIQGKILGGFDVGRTTDASEIYYVEEDENTHHQICRCNITFKNVKFPEQRRQVLSQINRLGNKLVKFGIDANGIGMNIYEDLKEVSYDVVERLDFNSNSWKEEACRRFKIRMEKKGISFSTNRNVSSQIHSIKRTLLPTGIWRFDVEANQKKHHGDKFWALLAASEVGHPPVGETNTYSSFNEQLVNGSNNKTNMNKKISVYIPQVASIMKFNPYGDFSHDMPMLSFNRVSEITSLIPNMKKKVRREI